MRRRFPELVCVCAALFMAVLFAQAFDLEAAGSDPQAGSSADGSAAQAAVRAPGAASGRPGGVAPSSLKGLPLDTKSARSLETEGASSGVPAGGLNTLQQRVLDRVNYYRAMAGVAPVQVDIKLLDAAQSHASYLGASGTTGHYETNKSNPYYTGYSPFDRITARRYAYVSAGEVVASEPSAHPARAVDALMAAIYHRFIILSGDYTQAGPGVTLDANQGAEDLDVTVDFGAEKFAPSPHQTSLTLYPFDGQQRVPTDFDPAQESPDPMPGHTLVGYPVSVQVDPTGALQVERFELQDVSSVDRPRRVGAKLLTHAIDVETPASAAALIPIQPLAPGTTYQAKFVGSVNGHPVNRIWKFNTAHRRAVTMTFASPVIAGGGVQQVKLHGLDREQGAYYLCYSPARLVRSLQHETETQFSMTTSTECEASDSCQVTVQATYHSTCTKPFAVGTFHISR